LPLSVFKQQL